MARALDRSGTWIRSRRRPGRSHEVSPGLVDCCAVKENPLREEPLSSASQTNFRAMDCRGKVNMPGSIRRRWPYVFLTSWLVICLSNTAFAQIRFNLRAQSLAVSLTTVANLANINVLFNSAQVEGIQAPPLQAELSAEDALKRLLIGTQLHLVHVNDKTISVVSDAEQRDAQSASDPSTGAIHTSVHTHLAYAGAGDTPLSTTASAGTDSADQAASNSNNTNRRRGGNDLDEVVVSAQKRLERLQDVPVPVTAISASALEEGNQQRLQDYFSNVPGLDLTTDFRGSSLIAIRGLSTGYGIGSPPVSVVIDDIPYTPSSALGVVQPPDLDPSDLSRIEVLRGPQGTLYGASSLGGLIKYVTLDPSTAGFSGRIQTSTYKVSNSSEEGYSIRGSMNAPLTDTTAIRAGGFYRRDPGYIDNVQTGQKDINTVDAKGGHVSALWKPSDVLSVKLSALAQRSYGYGTPYADADQNGLRQSTLRGTGWFRSDTQAYSAAIVAKPGDIEITSLTGYSVNSTHDGADGTYLLGPLFEFGIPGTGFDGFGVGGVVVFDNFHTKKLTQELRATGHVGQMLDWLVGGFYTHEESISYGGLKAADTTTGNVVGSFSQGQTPSTYTEYAAFTTLTFHLTDQFNIQLGGREAQNRQTYSELEEGFLGPIFLGLPAPVIVPKVHTKDNAFTYLVTPQYTFTPDQMLYARIASGYRPGGPNSLCSSEGIPCHFLPDRTTNYEIGYKGNVLNHKLSFDASLYYIKWKDIQTTVYFPPLYLFAGYANAGGAKSQGVELSVEAKPVKGLRMSAWVAFNDAVLTEALPSNGITYGVAGDRLPYSSKFSANFSLDEEFPVTDTVTAFVGGTVSYVGNRANTFTAAPPAVRQIFPAYAKTDLRTGVTISSWTLNLFATNIFDRRGVLSTNGFGTYQLQYIQPRTIGISLAKTF